MPLVIVGTLAQPSVLNGSATEELCAFIGPFLSVSVAGMGGHLLSRSPERSCLYLGL